MRLFFLAYPPAGISETASRKSVAGRKSETASRESELAGISGRFQLSWSHDVLLLRTASEHAGQMHLYLNYAREHWTMPGENPPVGLILCAKKHHSVAKYALEGLANKVLAAEYRTALPQERLLAKEIEKTRREIERRAVDVPRSRGRPALRAPARR